MNQKDKLQKYGYASQTELMLRYLLESAKKAYTSPGLDASSYEDMRKAIDAISLVFVNQMNYADKLATSFKEDNNGSNTIHGS